MTTPFHVTFKDTSAKWGMVLVPPDVLSYLSTLLVWGERQTKLIIEIELGSLRLE